MPNIDGPVCLSEGARLGEEIRVSLHAFEEGVLLEIKTDLHRVHHMKEQDIVAPMLEMLEPLEQLGNRHEEIRDQNDHPPAFDLFREPVEDRGDTSLLARRDGIDRVDEVLQHRWMGTGRDQLSDLVVEEHEAHGILLPGEEERQGSGDVAAVLVLGHPVGGVPHRLAAIEQEVGLEVRLLLVPGDVEPISVRVGLPVDGAGVIPGHVLPVLGKLHGEAVKGALVEAGDEPLDDQTRLEIQPRDPGEDLRT